jgi:hypothetical protein
VAPGRGVALAHVVAKGDCLRLSLRHGEHDVGEVTCEREAALRASGLDDYRSSLRTYLQLGITHFVLSDTPYKQEIARIGDQLLPKLREPAA